jgi:hypothetical protein
MKTHSSKQHPDLVAVQPQTMFQKEDRMKNQNSTTLKLVILVAMVVAVGSFVLSPMAFAGCGFSPSSVTINASPGQSVASGFTISGISETWFSEGWVTAWFSATGTYTNPYVAYDSPPDTIYPQSPPQKFQLPSSSTGFFSVNVPGYPVGLPGQQIVLQTKVKDWYTTCTATLTVNVVGPQGAPCSQQVTMYKGYNGPPVTATLQNGSGNWCLLSFPVPTGATPFIWNNAYYVVPDKSKTCLAGQWDGANCWYEPEPTGGFQVNDSFYVPGSSQAYCNSLNPTYVYDGKVKACLVITAPWGTHAFVYPINGIPNWYFTPEFTCKAGAYDGANCYIMTAPALTTAFMYSNTFNYLY